MKNKELIIDGVNMTTLAGRIGTPLMVYSCTKMEKQLKDFKRCLISSKFDTQVLYASKAFSCTAMAELVNNAGCGLDVVSGGEVYTAKSAGFPMERVFFHGNNKTPAEIHEALSCGVGTFVVDNTDELESLIAISESTGRGTNVVIRINPHISAHTHKYDVTADYDSKFGVSIDDPAAVCGMINRINASKRLNFMGFHAHIGSQIFDKNAFVSEIDVMMTFIRDMSLAGHRARWLDIGGGFAASYTEEDAPIPIPHVCSAIISACESAQSRLGVSIERLFIEPGRSIVGEAGVTMYTVGGTKKTLNKKFVFIDGGMCDNIRPALYQAKYSCDLAGRMDEEKTECVTVAGKCCESGDILAEDVMLPPAKKGDLLVMYTTGAYGYSMASNYNRIGRPPVIFVKNGTARCVIRRETYADMAALECCEDVAL